MLSKDTAKSHFSVTLEGVTKEEVAAKSTVSSPPVPSQNDFVGVVSPSLPLAIKNNDKVMLQHCLSRKSIRR